MAHPHAQSPPLPTNLQSPTTLSLVLATAIISSLAGYFLGQAASLGVFSSRPRPSTSNARRRKSESGSRDLKAGGEASSSSDVSSGEESEESEPLQGGLKTFEASSEECKMTLVVRTDLGMGKGKMAAQASHATLRNYTTLLASSNPILKKWERGGQAKVALQVSSLDELDAIRQKAVEAGLAAGVIADAGRTQIEAGSITCLAVGPGPRSVVDSVSGGLKLL